MIKEQGGVSSPDLGGLVGISGEEETLESAGKGVRGMGTDVGS